MQPPRHEDTKGRKHAPLSPQEERAGAAIVNAAFTVHKTLGPGLLERVYEMCFCHELNKLNLACNRQVDVPVVYDGLEFESGCRLDVLVDDLVVCELKAAEGTHSVWDAQLLTYMRLTKRRLGYLINFNVPLIKHGIQRFVL